MPTSSGWPSQVEYQDALMNPRTCFFDLDLRDRMVRDRTPFGAPQPISGQFANVYRLDSPGGERARAVRLFLRAGGPERTVRYYALNTHLQSLAVPLPCMISFEYQEKGISVLGQQYPLVKMDWITGDTLNVWVERNLYNAAALARMAEQWQQMTLSLDAARIAHGDLQHGNILVEGEAGILRLLDYDAVFVSSLSGLSGSENGHPSYQHPSRAAQIPSLLQDRFSALVIYAALRALTVAPELWYRLDNGDNLLFRREDFEDTSNSRAFSLLKTALLRAPETARVVEALRNACTGPVSVVPTLDRL